MFPVLASTHVAIYTFLSGEETYTVFFSRPWVIDFEAFSHITLHFSYKYEPVHIANSSFSPMVDGVVRLTISLALMIFCLFLSFWSVCYLLINYQT